MTFANVTIDRARLARHAREYLYDRGCLISRGCEIERQVRRAVLELERTDVKRVEEVVPAELRDSWVRRLLREVNPGAMTVLEWIRRPPKKRSPATLSDEAAKLQRVRELWPPAERLDISAARLRGYAQRMLRRRPARLREITEPRRTLEIAALLSSLASRQSDVVLQLIEMRINELWRKAQEHVKADPLPVLPDEVALELCRAVDDLAISDADYRMKARQLLASWGKTASRARTSRAAKVRERLTEDWRRLRALLKIVIPLDVCGEKNDDVVHALENLEDCYPNQWTDLWKDAHVPSGRAWRTLIESPDRLKDDPRYVWERSDANATRTRLYDLVGRVQLPELLIAMDGETHFTWELLGRAPSAAEELTPVYAAVLVAAMGLDRAEAAVMIPGVRPSAIRRASQILLRVFILVQWRPRSKRPPKAALTC
jgi:hypothetical protein